jgi:ribonuclease BN (tRNA processing enzyme)
MVKHILAAYREDIEVRKKGLEKANDTGHRVSVNEIGEGKVHEGDDLVVEALKVKHGAWRHSYAYKFRTPDRVVVISGDCSPTEEIIDFYRGCDVLVHDVYSASRFERRPERWKAYHRNSHTSSLELARIANEVRPGILVLTHQLLWGSTPEELMAEIRETYDGNVHFGNDLDVI